MLYVLLSTLLVLNACSPLIAEDRVHDLALDRVQYFRVHYHKSNKAVVFVACDSSYCSRLSITGWRKSGTLQYEGRDRCDSNGGGSCFLKSWATKGMQIPEKNFETGTYDFAVRRLHHRKQMGSQKNTMEVWLRNQPDDVAEVPITADSNRLTILPLEHKNMTVEWLNPAVILTENTARNGFNQLFGVTTRAPPTTTSRWHRRQSTTTRRTRRV